MIGKVIQCTFYILETPEADLPELHWNPDQYCSRLKIGSNKFNKLETIQTNCPARLQTHKSCCSEEG